MIHQCLIVDVVSAYPLWGEALADEEVGPVCGSDQGVRPFRVAGVRNDLVFTDDSQRVRRSATGMHDAVGTSFAFLVLPANCVLLRVGLPGLEPGTSSLSEKRDALQEVSRVCKNPANTHIMRITPFPKFQNIRLGCCTVAAHLYLLLGMREQAAATMENALSQGKLSDGFVKTCRGSAQSR